MPVAADTEGRDCAFLASGYGLTPFAWQAEALVDLMGVRSDGTWAASRVGLSVPRQNGKNAVAEMFELFVTAELGMRVLHSAHEVKTARKAFKRLLDFFDNPRQYPDLRALVKEIRRTNGQEAVELRNGGGVEFVARTKSSGRGYSADVLLLDEAQELTDEQLEAMKPTISASSNPMTFYMGTPPKPDKPAVVWRRVRAAAVAGSDPRQCWIEYGVEPEADLGSRESWAKANPGAPESISWDTIADEFADMSLEGFGAERGGVWFPQVEAGSVLDLALWATLVRETGTPKGPMFSVEVALDRSAATIGAAWLVEGRPHLEQVDSAPGVDWAVQRLGVLEARYGGLGVVVDASSEAASLLTELDEAGLTVHKVNGAQRAAACGQFYDLASTSGLSHNGDPALSAALGAARWKDVGEGARVFSRRRSAGDIRALYAVVLALHGLLEQPEPDPGIYVI